MKNVFIGLLIIAAGAGVYFFLIRKEKTKPGSEGFRKEWITGQWKMSVPEPVTDSATLNVRWDFKENGLALYAADTVKTDTLHYAWKKEQSILITTRPGDNTGREFQIIQLTADSMQWKENGGQAVQLLKVK